jgi:ATP-dependent HslUV protease ATP-binding subunit HslU
MATARQSSPTDSRIEELTPRQIVLELDRHIVGQAAAKKMVAIALRNRYRRQQLPEDIREEVSPKNIIMIGPTGVGKTEIARRLARLVHAPFIKVEATKYTEVGYVGRDVESMVRDLVETSIKMVREQKIAQVQRPAEKRAKARLAELIADRGRSGARPSAGFGTGAVENPTTGREDVLRRLERGELDDETVEVEVQAKNSLDGVYGVMGLDDQMLGGMKDMLDKIMPQRTKRTRMKISDAQKVLVDQEIDQMLDMEQITREAIERAEQSGIIFIDELDKIAGRDTGHGPDVSRQGVQRDILPIIEGCHVQTKHGLVRTDHILFIAAGAFHMAKPSDLIPELQGRFPLRVELESLKAEDFRRILTEPDHSLIEQYRELLKTDGVILEVTPDAVDELATSAMGFNQQTEDIGARRLHTVLERVFQEISFDAPDAARGEVVIDREYVKKRLESLAQNTDLSRFIL